MKGVQNVLHNSYSSKEYRKEDWSCSKHNKETVCVSCVLLWCRKVNPGTLAPRGLWQSLASSRIQTDFQYGFGKLWSRILLRWKMTIPSPEWRVSGHTHTLPHADTHTDTHTHTSTHRHTHTFVQHTHTHVQTKEYHLTTAFGSSTVVTVQQGLEWSSQAVYITSHSCRVLSSLCNSYT